MKAREMQLQFEHEIGQLANYNGYRFLSHEIELFLNSSQERIVKGNYSSEFGRRDQFFEVDEKSRRELSELITDYNATAGQFNSTASALHPNAVFAILPTNFLYTLKEDVTLEYLDCNNATATKITIVKPVTHDEYLMNINNPHKKPGKEVIWRMDYQSNQTGSKWHELIGNENVTLTNYHVRYIKRPQEIRIADNIPCELDESIHRDIVRMAVGMAMDSLKYRQILTDIKNPINTKSVES